MNWFKKSIEEVFRQLNVDRDGLSGNEADRRIDENGPNRIRREKEVSGWEVLLHQFTSPLIYVLFGALALTLLIESYSDAIVIGAVLIVNATVGFIQEYQAESAVQSLMKMVSPKALVIRDGEQQEIDSTDLVPGDIIRLQQGRVVPADARLVDVSSLQLNEAALTGESTPVSKQADAMPDAADDTPTADQQNMVFMGTAVTSGTALAVVVETGQNTKIGEIAEQVHEAAGIETPLESRIRRLTKYITVGILTLAVISSGIGWLMGRSLFEMVLLGVALAVAAIPAGLPIVVTVALALGVRRMAQRHAVIRNLPSVDTLGSTTLIVSDKTGTLTQNQMTVRSIYAAGRRFEVTGRGTSFKGAIRSSDGSDDIQPEEGSALWHTLLVGCLCNEAEVIPSGEEVPKKEEGASEQTDHEEHRNDQEDPGETPELTTRGDPMEAALLVSARKVGLNRNEMREQFPQRDMVPFKTEQRYMATVHEKEENGKSSPLVLVKGAPERIAAMCDSRMTEDGDEADLEPDLIVDKSEELAAEGLRVLAMAVGRGEEAEASVKSDNPRGLTFVGLQAMIDPPRPSAVEAVEACQDAGIRVIMVTGDHARTAAAIAKKMKLGDASDAAEIEDARRQESNELPEASTGQQLGRMDDQEFDETLGRVNVFARVEPGEKLRLVNRSKEAKEIVAVTGDGVNDAPALKSAHIGAAMGSGTDVAKDASDMVITNDDFASVYAAVEEGRTAFRNIRMATFFLLSTGAADILIIMAALAVGWPLPLLPAQILWCNVVTNGIADVALAFEPGEKALFKRPPRPPDEEVLNRMLLERLVLVGVWLATGTLMMFWWKSGGGHEDLTLARTAALTTLILFQKVHVFNCRSEETSIFKKSLWKNKVLFLGVIASLGVHIAALYIPWTQELLSFTPLDMTTWLVAIGMALTVVLINELHKKLSRRRTQSGGNS